MATHINTPDNSGSGFVLGIVLVLVVVGFGAWAMGFTPWSRQTNIVVETPAALKAPAAPLALAPSGDGTSTN
jgi:hypothetical protein